MDAYGIFVYMEHAASPSFPVRRHPYSASIATLLTVLHILRTTEALDIGLKLPLSPSTSNLLLHRQSSQAQSLLLGLVFDRGEARIGQRE